MTESRFLHGFRERLRRLSGKDAYSRPRWTRADIENVQGLLEIADAAKILVDTGASAFIGWEPSATTASEIDAAFDRLRKALGEDVPGG